MKNKLNLILLLFFIFVIYLISSGGDTPYNYFILLAKEFLNGRYYLVDNPPWLNELIPLSNGFWGVVYPPTPAVILMPFVYFFGINFPQNYISYLLGALLALITAKIVYLKTNSIEKFYFTLLLTAFGTIIWYLSSNGSVWYLGQISGAFFLTATIYESLTKRRPLLVSLFFALAVFSRLQLVLSIPLILFLNWKGISLKKAFFYLIPFGLLSLLFIFYNYVRFGSLFETGYSLIPGVLDEPWYSKGIFHFSYIKNNLQTMFLSIPIFTNSFPYFKPSWGGLSILFTTPVFLYLFFTNIKSRENIVTIISIILIATINLSHGGTGFTQFGYRYAVDFYPLLFLLFANYLTQNDLRWYHYLLLIFSIIVNLWGVVWISKYNWVSF
jgi:hypothetical protein